MSLIFNIVETAAPAGIIIFMAGDTTPDGDWLYCNGQVVSRVTYSDLYDAVGDTYGAGDGATTFGLPDFRGEFLRGLGQASGIDNGRVLGSNQGSAVASSATNPIYSPDIADGSNHTHTFTMDSAGSHSHTMAGSYVGGSGGYKTVNPISTQSFTLPATGNHIHSFTTPAATNLPHVASVAGGAIETIPNNIAQRCWVSF